MRIIFDMNYIIQPLGCENRWKQIHPKVFNFTFLLICIKAPIPNTAPAINATIVHSKTPPANVNIC